MPVFVQQGKISNCEAMAEVFLSKADRIHNSITHFWSVLSYHVTRIPDKLQKRPYIQYGAMNKISLAFQLKSDAMTFIQAAMPAAKNMGHCFKTEGSKDDFWDKDGTGSSASVATTVSHASTRSR